MRLGRTFRSSLLALAAMGAALGVAEADELRLGDWQALTHIVSVEGTQPFMAGVEEATGGEITFQHYPAQQAAKASGLLDAVKNGIVDVAMVGPIYNSDTLPLNSVIGLPGFYGTAAQGSAAYQAMIMDGPLRDEIMAQDVVPIYGFTLPPYQILAKERLGGPADWKGLDIRTSGATQAMIARSLGSVGISIPGPEIYTAVERGRLDGIMFPLPSVPGYNLNEVVSHISKNGSLGGYSFVMVANKDKWASLSEDARAAMLKVGAERSAHLGMVQDEVIAELVKTWSDAGIDVYDFTDDELAALKDAMGEVQSDWLTRIGKDSDTAKKVLEQYTALTAD